MGIARWLRRLTASTETTEVLAMIDGVPLTPIGELAEDVVGKIVGVVEPLDDRRVCSGISKRDVLGWGFAIDSLDIQPRARDVLPFVVSDGGHRAVIDVGHARMLIASTWFTKCRGVAGAPTHLQALLEEHGATDPDHKVLYGSWERQRPSKYRFSEWVIEPGMVVAVVGSGTREPDPRAIPDGYREDKATWIRIGGSPDRPIAVTDELD